MIVSQIVQGAELDVTTAEDYLGVEVTGGYAGDLLSGVMANAQQGKVWITWHVHPNIVADALVVVLSGVILVSGRQPEEETTRKAQEEALPILVSKLPAFEIIGRLHDMGLSGLH